MEDHIIYIRAALTLMYFTLWFLIVKNKSKTIWESFKGEDHILQVSELFVIAGIIGYVFMIPADAFWGISASERLWYGIDAVIMSALGISGAIKIFGGKEESP